MNGKAKIGNLLGGAGLKFLNDIITAKENGQQLPKVLDKIADVAIKGKTNVQDIAIETAKEEARKRSAWIVAGLLAVALVVVVIKKK